MASMIQFITDYKRMSSHKHSASNLHPHHFRFPGHLLSNKTWQKLFWKCIVCQNANLDDHSPSKWPKSPGKLQDKGVTEEGVEDEEHKVVGSNWSSLVPMLFCDSYQSLFLLLLMNFVSGGRKFSNNVNCLSLLLLTKWILFNEWHIGVYVGCSLMLQWRISGRFIILY